MKKNKGKKTVSKRSNSSHVKTVAKTKNSCDCGYVIFFSRIFLALIFLLDLVGKVKNSSGTIDYIKSAGFPLPEFFYVGAIVLLFIGSISLILGYRVMWGASALVLFTGVATLMFHIGDGQMIAFLKNLAIIGGLLALMSAPKGRFSLDK